ncbi:hypothetical protein [Streptomyces phytophilus]|uniref:hypothetical protein n=1 Tax=Streptomyces phytophilus TaxID=722715 RepID=UPI0015F0136C|nr:hypothetical protein [Streptomyces phytophilus]
MTTPHRPNTGAAEIAVNAVAHARQNRSCAEVHRRSELGSNQPLLRAAFFGRVNASPADDGAHRSIARQFHTCQELCSGRAVITHFFYDYNQPPEQAVAQRVGECAGPPERYGGWGDLAALISADPRAFDVIVCFSPDRISRRVDQFESRIRPARQHQMPIFYAMYGWPDDEGLANYWLTGMTALWFAWRETPC